MHRRILITAALLAPLAVTPAASAAAAPTASAAASCPAPKYPGSGYFTSLKVTRTTCATGKKVALAHYRCRTKNGRKGYCRTSVLRYRCTEKRVSIPTELNSRVTCKRGARSVVFTYQQDL